MSITPDLLKFLSLEECFSGLDSGSKIQIKNQLKRLHLKQRRLKGKIQLFQRAIGDRWRQYYADCKHNSIDHPKLGLPMVLQMSVPLNTGKYCTKISKLTIEANQNRAVIIYHQNLLKENFDDK